MPPEALVWYTGGNELLLPFASFMDVGLTPLHELKDSLKVWLFHCFVFGLRCSHSSLIGAAPTTRCILTTTRWIAKTDKSTWWYVESTRNILHCMHSGCMVIIIANVARFTLNFFTACNAGNKESLSTAWFIGVKVTTPRLHYCAAICACTFVFVLSHFILSFKVKVSHPTRFIILRSKRQLFWIRRNPAWIRL